MRPVFIPHVRGELIHQTSTLEGLTKTQDSSHCQTAAERLLDTGRQEYLEGASLERVLWDTQTGVCSEVLLGLRVKLLSWVCTRWNLDLVVADCAGGDMRVSMPQVWWVRPLLDLLLIPFVQFTEHWWLTALFSVKRHSVPNYCLLINIWQKAISAALSSLVGCENFHNLGD